MTRTSMFSVVVPLVLGCTYDNVQKSSIEADAAEVLLVIDSSPSMMDEVADLIASIDVFSQAITNDSAAAQGYRIGITTVTADFGPGIGFLDSIEPGEAGTLVAQMKSGDKNLTHKLRQGVACRAACWDGSELPSEPGYSGSLGDCPLPDIGVTREYLDCLCTDVEYPEETATWDSADVCGFGHEKHLEAALLTLCRAEEDPPKICWNHEQSVFDRQDDKGSIPEFFRAGTPVVIFIVTDEGDGSPLFSTQGETAEPYLEAFEAFDRDITVAVVGPALECEDPTSDLESGFKDCDLTCNSGNASQLQTGRLIDAAVQTNGFYNFISEPEQCDVASFAGHFEDLATLIKGQ